MLRSSTPVNSTSFGPNPAEHLHVPSPADFSQAQGYFKCLVILQPDPGSERSVLDAVGGEDAELPMAGEEKGVSRERWGGNPGGIICAYFRGKSGARKRVMMLIGGTQMINPNCTTSASMVFFTLISFLRQSTLGWLSESK